jgi:hypothetical protein
MEVEVKRLQREKQARVYYQNIVYKVCTLLDAIEGRCIEHGKGIVCGTLETPETEVEEAMERTKAKIERLQAVVHKLRTYLRGVLEVWHDDNTVDDFPIMAREAAEAAAEEE